MSIVRMGDLVTELCERAGLKFDRTNRIEIDISEITFHVFPEDPKRDLEIVRVPARF